VPVEESGRDTRARIVAAAVHLFARQGYQRTSIRQIAERLGVSKAAVLYHFPAKDRILAAVAEPLIADLEGALRKAEALGPERAPWAALEGWLDATLRHRRWLRMVMQDLALLAGEPVAYRRLMRVATRVVELVAGPDPDPARQVRAVQARAMLGDPLVYLPHVPDAELRAEILAGLRRFLADGPAAGAPPETPVPPPRTPVAPPETPVPPPETALAPPADAVGRPRPTVRRRPGRPSVLTADQVALARQMYAEGTRSADEIAATLGVSRATLYRHLHQGQPAAGPRL
jgi:AcrR family transcriptional regulator